MKRTAKVSLGLIGLLLGIGLLGYLWQIKARADATFHLANGVQVTPIAFHADEMSGLTAAMLNVKVWKFDVVFPATGTYEYALVRCQKGKPVESIQGGMVEQPNHSRERHSRITMAFIPQGDDFAKAERLKCFFSNNVWSYTSELANPLKGAGGLTQNAQASTVDNLIYLLSSSKTPAICSAAAENDVAIALSIHEGAPLHFTAQ